MKNLGVMMIFALMATVGLSLLAASGCSRSDSSDDHFVEVANAALEKVFELNPEWATNLGDHRFDHQVSDLSESGFEARVEFNQGVLATLAKMDPDKLSQANRIDYEILTERSQEVIFSITEIREHRWNPTVYNPGDGIYNLLARDFAPLNERLSSVKSRLEQIPGQLEAAKANLHNPPRVMTETAINQNQGVINLVMDGLQEYLVQAPDSRSELASARSGAIAALDDYGSWLKKDLLPRSNGDFRLGAELWREKLRYSLSSDLSPEEILASAQKDLTATTDRMVEIAGPLFHDYFGGHPDDTSHSDHEIVRRVLSRLADQHPTNETIIDQAARDLAEITEFVRENNLVSVPDAPVELITMPEHKRGFYIAYCDSPGPLEQNGTTFYAISPTPVDWSPERSETFYREYNDFMLQDLTIHEAMPGHYLQIAKANAFAGSTPLRAIFSSGTFVEGWATYAEQLMVETGFAGPELHLQQLKMRLRLIINAIIDQKIHTADMTEGEAMQMMMVEGFQEEGEAAGKWVRASLTSTQLSTYYVGNLEINQIRRDYQEKAGKRFEMKRFHDALLGFGSPAPKYVRRLLDL
ncbi:MAG: DUF885 domain-containing protein [Gemmatimonadales bacterium]|nr:DUF885 domain-containing protein [Gemmatimonadales bacterium]